jgi:hypothetical protein
LFAINACNQTRSAANPGSPDAGEPPAVVSNKAPEPEPEKPKPEPLRLPPGTVIEARLDQTLSTKTSDAGDKFEATLDSEVRLGERLVIPKGARIRGHVTTSDSSGRLQGRALLGLTLDAIEYQGKMVAISTNLDSKTSEAHKKRNIELIGGAAGLGALIGGIAGGGRGAAIGAAAGAGAGTGAAAATGKLEVTVPAETVLTFRLKKALELS